MENQTTEPEPIAVDVMGAARMLGLGRSSVLNLADSGQLPRLRFGRSVRFAVSDVEALVEQRRGGYPGGGRGGRHLQAFTRRSGNIRARLAMV